MELQRAAQKGLPVPSQRPLDDNSLTFGLKKVLAMLESEAQVKADIVLEPELLNSLCRRGRRRLRDIQETFQVSVWLDKTRCVLHITGSEACVNAAKHHVAGLAGPRKAVKAAVHAELLRTRMLLTGSEAALARIQEGSGCRLHIERSRQEVRLFGHSDSIAAAQRLLEELDKQCTQEVVPLEIGFTITRHQLDALALACGVALQCEEGRLILLGLRESVKKAVEQIGEYLKDPQKLLELPVPQEANEQRSVARSDASVPKVGLPMGEICPTCRACPYCASCGAPTTYSHQMYASPPMVPSKNGAHNHLVPSVGTAPSAGQQMPYVAFDNGMVGGAVVVQGMVPTTFMIPANMMQHSGGLG